MIAGLSAIPAAVRHDPDANPTGSIILGLVLTAVGIYFLRGRGVNPAKAQQAAAAAQRRAALVTESVDQAAAALAAAPAGGAALVAYRNLESTVTKFYGMNAPARLEWELSRIEFDTETIAAQQFGYVPSLAGGNVEIFPGWVVFGQEAHNVDATTRGVVHTDGAIQVSSAVVTDRKSRERVVSQQHDLRRAQLQLTSSTWSLSTPIHPDHVNHARAILARLAAQVESLAEAPVTRSDIREILESLVNNDGQPAAQKIRQLNNLRYERLLTDEEFKRVKDKILGLDAE